MSRNVVRTECLDKQRELFDVSDKLVDVFAVVDCARNTVDNYVSHGVLQ